MYQNEKDVGVQCVHPGFRDQKSLSPRRFGSVNYARQRFMASVDQSLEYLLTDYIDLLLVHWPRGGAPIAEQIEGLNRAVQSGKVRYIGVSNYSSDMLRAAAALSNYPWSRTRLNIIRSSNKPRF